MSNTKQLFLFLFLSGCLIANCQTTNFKFGIWKSDNSNLNNVAATFNDVKGSLVIIKWKDIQSIKAGMFDWNLLNNRLKDNNGKPIILLIWLWQAGKDLNQTMPGYLYNAAPSGLALPKVPVCKGANSGLESKTPNSCANCNDNLNNLNFAFYAPPFYSTIFRDEVKILADSVKKRVVNIRNGSIYVTQDIKKGYDNIIGIQACIGSTGDFPGYKGCVKSNTIQAQYDFGNYFKEMTKYFDSLYKNTGLHVLHNPGSDNLDLVDSVVNYQNFWALNHPWIKMGDVGHAYQINGESNYYKTLLYGGYFDKPVSANNEFIYSRGELSAEITESSGWWKSLSVADSGRKYRNMLALTANALYFGLDWSNQQNKILNATDISDTFYRPAFAFYNKYAGQRDPKTATNAFCLFRDGLDASNTIRFPESGLNGYGAYNLVFSDRLSRFHNIVSGGALPTLDAPMYRGARLDNDTAAVGNSSDNRASKGINDVGDNILEGNYEKYLYQENGIRQISEPEPNNINSIGFWNVIGKDTNSIYGRYARGISQLDSPRNIINLTLNEEFYQSSPEGISLDSVQIAITYFDDVVGSFEFFYKKHECINNSPVITVTGLPPVQLTAEDQNGINSKLWKQVTYKLPSVYIGPTGLLRPYADFSIKNPIILSNPFGLLPTQQYIKFALLEIYVPKKKIPTTVLCTIRGVSKSNNTKTNSLLVIPNPASSTFHIELKIKETIKALKITNHYGRTVYSKNVNSNVIEVAKNQIGGLPGIYFIEAITIKGNKVRSQIKIL